MILSLILAASLWGWDGGDPQSPDVQRRHALTQAAWIRIPVHGDMVYSNKNSTPNWAQSDRDVFGWSKLGVKIILSTPFHPPDLKDAEIVPWLIKFNADCLNRYVKTNTTVEGIEPLNEPWLDNENMANKTQHQYLNARLGATHTNATHWVGGQPGADLDSLTPEAIRWYAKMRRVLVGVHDLAAVYGIRVYGPHWSNERYVGETKMLDKMGVFDGIDVFTFGVDAKGPADGPTGWANTEKLLASVSKPWAVTEFHLRKAPNGPPDADAAKEIRKGMAMWRKAGVQCVLIHTGLQNWTTTDKTDPQDWRSLAGYIDNRTSESLRALQVELADRPCDSVIVTNEVPFLFYPVTMTNLPNVDPKFLVPPL